MNLGLISLFEEKTWIAILFVCYKNKKFYWNSGENNTISEKFEVKRPFRHLPTPSWPKILHLFPHDFQLNMPKGQIVAKRIKMFFINYMENDKCSIIDMRYRIKHTFQLVTGLLGLWRIFPKHLLPLFKILGQHNNLGTSPPPSWDWTLKEMNK